MRNKKKEQFKNNKKQKHKIFSTTKHYLTLHSTQDTFMNRKLYYMEGLLQSGYYLNSDIDTNISPTHKPINKSRFQLFATTFIIYNYCPCIIASA